MSLPSWFINTVTVASETGRDAYGKPTYGPKRSVACNLSQQSRLLHAVSGENVVASWKIYTDQAISLTDRIWLPGSDTSVQTSSRMPIAITVSNDKPGTRQLVRVDL